MGVIAGAAILSLPFLAIFNICVKRVITYNFNRFKEGLILGIVGALLILFSMFIVVLLLILLPPYHFDLTSLVMAVPYCIALIVSVWFYKLNPIKQSEQSLKHE
jgi:uncharacterized membrane protein YqjE